MKVFLIAASRGRKLNGSDQYTQCLEINEEELCNALTTAYKDNLVIEIEVDE
jgi:hypothetical protein